MVSPNVLYDIVSMIKDMDDRSRGTLDFWRRGHRGALVHKTIEFRSALPTIFSLSRQHKPTLAGSICIGLQIIYGKSLDVIGALHCL